MMKASLRWFVVAVLSLDAVAALSFLAAEAFGGRAGEARAAAPAERPATPAKDTTPAPPPKPAPAQGAAVAPAEAPVKTVAKPSDDDAAPATDPADPSAADEAGDGGWAEANPEPAKAPESVKGGTPAKVDAFTRLQRAYETMEPESAAKALNELATRDREAVVALVLGLKPRTSGAILDAVTQINPALAADLSYTIWKRSGKPESRTAKAGR